MEHNAYAKMFLRLDRMGGRVGEWMKIGLDGGTSLLILLVNIVGCPPNYFDTSPRATNVNFGQDAPVL